MFVSDIFGVEGLAKPFKFTIQRVGTTYRVVNVVQQQGSSDRWWYSIDSASNKYLADKSPVLDGLFLKSFSFYFILYFFKILKRHYFITYLLL